MVPPSNRNQPHDAQTLYDSRSASYDKSWHPRFAQHMVELAQIRPGERILDLACGTGLCSFAAAAATGPTGHVVGVDISTGMLSEAWRKLSTSSCPTIPNVEFHQHSISDLGSLEALAAQGLFDVVTCCSALVLFENPAEVVKGWMGFLRPGGRVVVDVTHPGNLVAGVVMERVGREVGRPVPFYRLNFGGPGDLREVMEGAGLGDVEIRCVSQCVDRGSDGLEGYLCELEEPVVVAEYEVGDADEIFERSIGAVAFAGLREPAEVRQRAKEAFRRHWAAMADADGKVRDIDMVFVGIGRKA